MSSSLRQAIQLLKAGKVVAIPTETVYGLAANAYDPAAVAKIFRIKKRPLTSPLIVHVADQAQVTPLITAMPPLAIQLARHFWAGPLTLILTKSPLIPDIVTAGKPRVGIRIPSHPLTQELLRALPFPLAAPSANPFGYISPTTAAHVEKQLGNQVDYILDGGAAQRGLESTIVGFEKDEPILYRLGSISQEALEEVLGTSISYHLPKKNEKGASQLSSGRLPSHYAPRTPLRMGMPTDWALDKKRIALLNFRAYRPEVPLAHQFVLSPKGNLEEAAQRLFAGMHYLDDLGLDILWVERLPDEELGRSMNDRLARASHPTLTSFS